MNVEGLSHYCDTSRAVTNHQYVFGVFLYTANSKTCAFIKVVLLADLI